MDALSLIEYLLHDIIITIINLYKIGMRLLFQNTCNIIWNIG